MKNVLSILEDKDLKDLAYVQGGLVTESATDGSKSNGVQNYNVWGPQGKQFGTDRGSGWVTQGVKWDQDWIDAANEELSRRAESPEDQSSREWDNWSKMHEGVMWFDTKACWKGSHIGDINKVSISNIDESSQTYYDQSGTRPTDSNKSRTGETHIDGFWADKTKTTTDSPGWSWSSSSSNGKWEQGSLILTRVWEAFS